MVKNKIPPCFLEFTQRPNENGSAAGIKRMAKIWSQFENGVGFSKGCALLTLKKPPPLVPSCLMAICEAAGPSGSTCSLTSAEACKIFTILYSLKVCTTPCETSASARTKDKGKRMYKVERVKST